jgi:hypothetical protein
LIDYVLSCLAYYPMSTSQSGRRGAIHKIKGVI